MNTQPDKPQQLPNDLSISPRFDLSFALGLLACCLVLGVAADALLHNARPGFGATLFGTLLYGVLWFWTAYKRLAHANLLLLTSLLILSWLLLWRDSPFLQGLNIAVQIGVLLLVIAQLGHQALRQTTFAEVGLNLARLGIILPFRPLVFVWQTPWRDLSRTDHKYIGFALAIARGLALTLPVTIIFAMLLSAADSNFETWINTLFRWDMGRILGYTFRVLFLAVVFTGLFAQYLTGDHWQPVSLRPPRILQLGNIETAMICGALILLFSSFMIIQFGYLFGGEARVIASELTYAQYGRRGFFELVTVTVLLHFVLLVGLWLTEDRATRLYRWLATALVVLLYGVIWSALTRLGLYISVYGLTELRFYSSAMTLFIGALMPLLLLRLHRPAAFQLAPSYLMLGIAAVVVLYLSNPDAQIARYNLSRAPSSVAVDIQYLHQLSLDAVPVLISARGESALVKQVLEQKRLTLPVSDWRSLTISRWQAARQLTTDPTRDTPTRVSER